MEKQCSYYAGLQFFELNTILKCKRIESRLSKIPWLIDYHVVNIPNCRQVSFYTNNKEQIQELPESWYKKIPLEQVPARPLCFSLAFSK